MRNIKNISSSIIAGFILSLLFAIPFLDLFDRPFIDQFLLVSISTASSGFIIFLWLDSRGEKSQKSQIFALKEIWQKRTELGLFFHNNIPGLILALTFFIVYIYIGAFFNTPLTATIDNYLDADNGPWIQLIADPNGFHQEMRVPHPFAFFIFRPLGWFANLFFQDPFRSATFLNALAGGVSIFLAWLFVKAQTKNRIYAFLIATLLGLSTSHLVFGSIVESYIFSATVLIGFFWVLQVRKDSMPMLISLSLLSFGITITNFIQTLIGFSISDLRWKRIFYFGGVVVSMGVILTLIHAAWYPSSKPFYLTSSSYGENAYVFSIFQEPPWEIIGRLVLLVRTFLLYSIIAPIPFVLLEEVGGSFPSFQFFKTSNLDRVYLYSEYNGFGNILVFVWVLFVFVAGIYFLWKLFKSRKFNLSFAFVLCLLFSFVLHFFYGEDPFLYSTNWTYALVFFVSFGLAPLGKYRLFQVFLTIFLFILAYNQWQFITFMMDVVSHHLG